MTQLRILPEVFQDTAEAANWYDERESGLGDRFLICFRGAYTPIRTNPFAYKFAYMNYRKVLLDPFPYALYFRVHDEIAIITLVFHTARNPRTLQRILRKREKLN